MPLYSFEGKRPNIHPDAWIAPTATLVGDVTVEADASVWYGVVLRADFGAIVVRAGANVQDNSVVHVGEGTCEIGPDATVGHLCVIHHCVIGAEALVGNGSTVLDGAVVGARALVAAGSTVSPGTEVPPETVAFGSPARRFAPLTGPAKQWVDGNPAIYRDLARRHRDGTAPVD
ncbi:gamma carbonic anhydrase family protein [Actinophytocola gossypii]|uniref:Gamma carbonic anhydrase family protein n=1 Tax=Actinophytocola gossypii TaxID=2812003 RepID=A0ABT2J3S8_9PSEU|nr:gamma carbonic anhydrase family protein [Actinophytocola gossypii]MCT2582517.1 gamma carbonic anhydrase family protein [Actinophytocola gossypii]